jgi:murein DD-endopeptidase MepM/ murein hydrolase activator NlpD
MSRSVLASILLSVLICLAGTGLPAGAQTDRPPFGLPFATPPGPDTWTLVQAYGNTAGAYTMRRIWYGSGQGIHFGIDFGARCGTQVVAIGDGAVLAIDNLGYGSGPHNLLIAHPNGYVSLYGHLLKRPDLSVGQAVKRGDPIALTGDPDLTCSSRPHLHLEVRDRTLNHALDAANFIDTDWDMLMLAGGFGRGFQRNLDNPRQWQLMTDQPEIYWGGPLVNDYQHTWPYDWR